MPNMTRLAGTIRDAILQANSETLATPSSNQASVISLTAEQTSPTWSIDNRPKHILGVLPPVRAASAWTSPSFFPAHI